MATQPVKGIVRQVKPLISSDALEAKRRVMSLYRAWFRQIPSTIIYFKVPLTVSGARERLKNEFLKHKNVRDLRVIDMLVVKGQMDLKEIVNGWKQPCHVMYMVKDTVEPKPKDFLAKFIAGID